MYNGHKFFKMRTRKKHKGVAIIPFPTLPMRIANHIYFDLERIERNETVNGIKTPGTVKRAMLDAWVDATNVPAIII